MKSRFLLFCVFVLVLAIRSSDVRAQYSIGWIGSTTWVGVEGGLSLANETFDSIPLNSTANMQTGVLGGITAEHWFNNNIAIGASVLYDQKGIAEQYAASAENRQTGPNESIYSGNDNFSMSYLEIPIVLKYALGTGFVRPYVCVGPSFGMLLSASETSTGSLASVPDIKSNLASSDVSIYAALGAMDEMEHGPILFFEAGYAAGLTSLFQSTPSRMTTDGNSFPQPIDPTGAKSGDIRVTLGAMWQI